MNILFVHQSFPGQYRNVIRHLSRFNHRIVGLGINPLAEKLPANVQYHRYQPYRSNCVGIDPWLLDVDTKLIRGQSCANAAFSLKSQGFQPDIICAHPGWGEALFLKDIWPSAPLLSYQEFFYNPFGYDYDFDPEHQQNTDWTFSAKLRLKNCNPLLMLDHSDWNITPTNFQKSCFPSCYSDRFSVIHDGIDTVSCSPDRPIKSLSFPTVDLGPQDQIVTFVNRHIEPYRGCHTFIRSIPFILDSNPNVHIVVVGEEYGVSYGQAAPDNSWKQIYLSEIKDSYDINRLHFVGSLPYPKFLDLLRLSSCHVYLTYPFVLSWSLLEAMSFATPIVASKTPPVMEVIEHERNGLLVDFFSPVSLSDAVTRVLRDNELSSQLSRNSRSTVMDKYSLDKCVPLHVDLITRLSRH